MTYVILAALTLFMFGILGAPELVKVVNRVELALTRPRVRRTLRVGAAAFVLGTVGIGTGVGVAVASPQVRQLAPVVAPSVLIPDVLTDVVDLPEPLVGERRWG